MFLGALACERESKSTPTLPPARASQIEALGYAQWQPDSAPRKRGVTLDRATDRDARFLFTSRPRKSAQLIDRAGRIVQRWVLEASPASWQHVEALPDGGLLVIVKDEALLRLDRDSNLVFERPLRVHHDLARASDGRLFVLARRQREVPLGNGSFPILDDLVVELTEAGEVVREMSLFDRLGSLVSEQDRERIAEWSANEGAAAATVEPSSLADPFHTNSIQLVAWGGLPAEGALLLSLRNRDRIVVIETASGRLLWQWGEGVAEEQHHATLEPDGRILVFDNGTRRHASRILSVDPASGSFDVLYAAPHFYSQRRGGVERTPSGGLLVAESAKGRLFEVDAQGDLVWEFWNPDTRPGKGGRPRRAAIYRVERREGPPSE